MRPRSDMAIQAHNAADIQQDAGREDVAKLLNACGGELSALTTFLYRLAWAAVEPNKRKRLAALELTRMEMQNQGLSTSFLPMPPTQ